MLVREFVDGQDIDQVLLVRDRSRGAFKLGDRTGCMRARVPSELAGCCVPGTPVRRLIQMIIPSRVRIDSAAKLAIARSQSFDQFTSGRG